MNVHMNARLTPKGREILVGSGAAGQTRAISPGRCSGAGQSAQILKFPAFDEGTKMRTSSIRVACRSFLARRGVFSVPREVQVRALGGKLFRPRLEIGQLPGQPVG